MEPLDATTASSPDIVAENIAKLRELFPECFTEGSDEDGPRFKVDFGALKETLGDYVEDKEERYSFTWNGKARARRIAQTPSTGTLRPCSEESVNWGATQNLFIEGDNLEVLKLLQKSYHHRVKMIYIDPPYNTGKEFIYPDRFQDNLSTYLQYTGQVGSDGLKLSANTESAGRYHTNWLNMMLPRLRLARNLLRWDGILFISIDDHEAANLKKLCDEIFGEENFVATFVRKRRMATGMRGDVVSPDHEYVLAYSASRSDIALFGRVRSEGDYPFKDAIGKYRSTDLTVGMTREMRPNQFYAITNPRTGAEYWPPDTRVWRFYPATMEKEIACDNIIWPDDNPDRRMSRPRYKTRFDPDDGNQKTSPVSTWISTLSESSSIA